MKIKINILLFFENIIIINCCCNKDNNKEKEITKEDNKDSKKDKKDKKEEIDKKKKEELDKLIKESVNKTVVIKESDTLNDFKSKNNDCIVEMKKNKTIDTALKYIKDNPNNKVCILNFANWISPGSNQEGSIRNATTIDNNLDCEISKKEFYNKHNAKDEKKANDDIIYSPDVIILKDDSGNDLSDFYNNNKIDIISCAAPNKTETLDDETILKLQNKRMRRILDVADYYNVDILILGAFGCGVFQNPADKLANEYSEILKDKTKEYNKKFKKIVFAIPDDTNYNHFNKVFNNFTFN